MKLSNKILLAGCCLPIVLTVVFVLFMSIRSTDSELHQLGPTISLENVIIN
jgi:hypothetical protein